MDETLDVVPSADNGNVPVDAPSEQPTTETPAEPVEAAQPAEPELYELPDGRKVDADTLSREWKENFYPEYTRKSQELAKVKTETLPNSEPTNPHADPDWVPQSYAELIEIAKQEMKSDLVREQQAVIERQQAVENEVASQIESLKKSDPTLDENKLFLHANKYGFRDLPTAYQNMKDMAELAKSVQKTTANNIAKRNDPVSISPGATGIRPDPSQFATARDYLRSLNN